MIVLVAFTLMVGSALAAPQVGYNPAAYHQHFPYAAPFKGAHSPLAYSAAPSHFYKPAVHAYAHPGAYAAPAVAAHKPVQQYPAAAYPYHHADPYSSHYIKPIAIVRQSQDDNLDGSFNYDFEGENGIASQASGYVKNAGTDAEAQVIQGQFSYTAPDGTPVVTRYYADESGYHAEGSHLPAAPADPYRTL